ncbi:hypothetical protein [Cohnella thailandensis]|uniref:Endolytic transglycosylase MltG n=1 Tax=Cohnella thailandensis TaxID=557557 RepID=A0A841T6F8_9BACL|nr:hypothetical protein [Cohnella thailandensis]MBB6636731.1 hypothetical protein [Cohnella thailandensis]MBP1973393.1 hypothetical protein [Cohnella thailandensis]
MLKRRGLLIGFGLGLMIGAAVLQLILAAEKGSSSLSLTGTSITEKELQEEAEAQGYTLVKSSLKTYTQEELDAAVLKAREEAQASLESGTLDGEEQTGSKAGEGASKPASTGAASGPSAGASQAPSNEEEHTYSFYIRANATLIEVATGLQELGLIADKDQFVKQAKAYSKSLRVGTSTFVGKPTFEEIIAEITRAKY